MNDQNEAMHRYYGTYAMSALVTSLSQVLTPMFCNGKRSQTKYIEKPIRLFEMTEEEKAIEQEKARQAFIAWAGLAETKYKKKGGTENARSNDR